MRIVFIGNVDFSLHCLNEVLKNGGTVAGVVSLKQSALNSDYCDLAPAAAAKKIPMHYCSDINAGETITWIREKSPDMIFCWGFSQLIKSELLSLPPMGVLGAHPALLPQNRGRHPLIWALALGLKKSGLTFFRMDEGADSGPIISQKQFSIDDSDDAGSLYQKIKRAASEQIADFLPQLLSGTARFSEQDHTKASYWRKRSKRDGIIDWRMSVSGVHNLVRALTRPYPGAEFNYRDQTVKVWKAGIHKFPVCRNTVPGKIVAVSGLNPVIKCYDGAIELLEYEPRISFTQGEHL